MLISLDCELNTKIPFFCQIKKEKSLLNVILMELIGNKS